MPATRNRTTSGTERQNDSPSKGKRQTSRNKDVETETACDSPTKKSPSRRKQGQVTSADDSSPASHSSSKPSDQLTPDASPRKRGRPKKDGAREKSVPSVTPKEKGGRTPKEKGASEKDEKSKTSESKNTAQSDGDGFSPRRSGRGVVFNRRYQDMEMDFGKKRPRGESSDEPKEKRAKKQTKKEVEVKVQKTLATGTLPGKDTLEVTNYPLSQGQATIVSSSSVSSLSSTKQIIVPPSSTPSSPPRIMIASPHPSASVLSKKLAGTGTSLASEKKTLAVSSSLPFKSTPVSPPAVLVSTSLAHSALSSAHSALSSAQSALPTAHTVSITSSTAMLARSAPSLDDKNTKIAAEQTPAQSPVKSNAEKRLDSAEALESGATAKVGAVNVQSADSVVEKITESSSVVDASIVAGQRGMKESRVVNISPVLARQGAETATKGVVDTPGRVVAKQTMEKSKSIFIVSNPPAEKLSATRTLDASTEKEGAGDVMSLVELSPNKKVPVVLAKRTEHASLVGKVVKVYQVPSVQQEIPQEIPQQKTTKEVVMEITGRPPQQKTRQVNVTAESTLSSQSPVKQGDSGTATEPKIKPKESESSQTTSAETGVTALAAKTQTNNSLPAETDMQTDASESGETAETTASETAVTTPAVSIATSTSAQLATPSTPPLGTVSDTSLPETLTPSTSADPTILHTVGPDADLNTSFSDSSQSQAQGDNVLKSVSNTSFTEEDEDDDDEDNDENTSLDEKFSTSGTQTPYAKSNVKKVITVHVHPPSKKGEKNREVITVTKIEPDDDQRFVHRDFGSDSKGKYIYVDLPEGTAIKHPIVRSRERFDLDPNFYTMDEQGMFVCHICNYKTLRRPNFYKHKKKHLGLRQYSCDKCPYQAATSSNLKRHMEIHKDIRNHKCPKCDLLFRQKIHLERHIKYRHEEKKVKCPFCDYICANENPDLKVHIKRRHIAPSASEEAMKCPECGIVATSKRDLRQHLKFHSKGPELKLFCNMCSFVTDCESRLRRHQYIHTKEKPFQCGLCEYRGSQKEHVLRHMRSQHNIDIARNKRTKKTDSEKGGEGETSKSVEKADYTSEEKIFACNHCTMKFAKLINLYKHLHTQHRDIMPSEQTDFSCVVCDFHTTNKKNLLVHMRRHNVTDQSPPSHVYSCVLCRYMNPKRRNLFQHMRKKHHIEIVTRDDGSTTCYVANDPVTGLPASSGASVPMSPSEPQQSVNSVITVLPLSDLISTVSQPTDLQGASDSLAALTSSSMPSTIKMEDIAMVVSNPQNASITSMEGESSLVDSAVVETITIGGLSQDDAAEAIQGLQALAQRGVLDGGAIVEEQVQVMGSDDQTTLVIDPSGLEQLVQPKAEPLEVVEIDSAQLLEQVNVSSLSAQQETGLLEDSGSQASVSSGQDGFQLSAEQLMNLNTGDLLEINGEMFKVEVSTETNPDGSPGQQVISFEPANIAVETLSADTELEDTEMNADSL